MTDKSLIAGLPVAARGRLFSLCARRVASASGSAAGMLEPGRRYRAEDDVGDEDDCWKGAVAVPATRVR